MSTYTYNISDFSHYVELQKEYTGGYSRDVYGSGTKALVRTMVTGLSGSEDTEYTTVEDRMYTAHNAVLPDYITDSETTFQKATISFTLKSGNPNDHIMGIFVVIPSQVISGEDRDKWVQISNGTIAGRIYLGLDDYSAKEIEITEAETIKKFLKYGVALRSTTSSGNWGETHLDTATCTQITVTLEFASTKLPPTIDITKPTTGAHFCVTDPIELSWTYAQSANVTPDKFTVMYNMGNGWKTWGDVDGRTSNVNLYASIISRISDSGVQNVSMCVRGIMPDNTYYDSDVIDVVLSFVDCTEMSPARGEARLSNEKITLKWKIVLSDGSPEGVIIQNYPERYQILYSVNSGENWVILIADTVVDDTETGYSYTIPENVLPSGIITWKAQPWIDDYVVSTYKKENFVVRVQASTSSVYCDGKPQPTLSWHSTAQVAYQVRFDEYDSGAVYGTEQSFTIPYFYTDGVYRVQIRTQASSGVWSPWTEAEYVTITNIAEYGEISLSVNPTRHAVAIEWNSEPGFVGYILYRNGVPVYAGGERSFTDVGANGTAEYCVRGVADTGYYAISETITVDATPKTDCIYDMDNQIWIPLKYSQAPRTRGYGRTAQVHYNYYAGRRNPVAFTEGNIDTTVNVSYLLKTREEAERVLNLAGKMVLYKDTNGGVLIGIVTDPGYQSERFYPVSFTITGVDYNEAVKYEAVSG